MTSTRSEAERPILPPEQEIQVSKAEAEIREVLACQYEDEGDRFAARMIRAGAFADGSRVDRELRLMRKAVNRTRDTKIETLTSQLDEAREALRPFAELGARVIDGGGKYSLVPVDDLRRAASALETKAAASAGGTKDQDLLTQSNLPASRALKTGGGE